MKMLDRIKVFLEEDGADIETISHESEDGVITGETKLLDKHNGVDLVYTIVKIEDHWGIEISDDEYKEVKTFGDLVGIVKSKLD